MIAAYTYLLT